MSMTLFLQYDHDSDQYEIWVRDGRMGAMPAGGRLFHPDTPVPIPEVRFAHDDRVSAEIDAGKLRAYLGALAELKMPNKGRAA